MCFCFCEFLYVLRVCSCLRALVSYDSETLLCIWSCVCGAAEEASEFLKFLQFLVHDDPVLYTTFGGNVVIGDGGETHKEGIHHL